MAEYYVGQIFIGEYPADCAQWCNNNECFITEIEPKDNKRRFRIDAVPQPTPAEEKARRKAEFEAGFFNTSLGYIRRKVTMADGSTKDFLSDLLPAITKATEMGMVTKVIAYDKPPFDKDVEDWTQYQHNEVVTKEFIQECMLQLQADFGIVEVA